MASQTLDLLRRHLRGTTIDEYHWDDIRTPLLEWADFTVNDINQIRLDLFGSTYSLDNDGHANLASALYNVSTSTSALTWIFSGAVTFSGSVAYSGTTTFSGNVRIFSGFDLLMYSDAGSTLKASIDGATGNTTLAGTLGVTGATTLSSTLSVPTTTKIFLDGGSNTSIRESAADTITFETGGSDRASINSAGLFNVVGAATVGTTLGVTGATTLSSTLSAGASTLASLGVTGAATVGTTLGVAGATTLSSTLSAGASTLASLGVTGAATVGTTLGVTGATTLSSTLSVPTTTKIFLDGGSNTSIRESAADTITFETGGSDRASINSAGLFNVVGAATVGTTFSAGASTLASLSVTGAATVGTTLEVTGDANFDSGTFYVDAANNRTYSGATSATTGGTLTGCARQLISSGTAFDLKVSTATGINGIRDEWWHNSSSPSSSDDIYDALYGGNNSIGTHVLYASLSVSIDDTTNGSEDASFYLKAMKAGTRTDRILIGPNHIRIYDDLFFSSNNTYDIGEAAIAPKDIYSVNALTVTSDKRNKKCIEQADLGLDFINSLNPVKFKWDEAYKKVVSFSKEKIKDGKIKEIKKVTKVKKSEKEKRFHYGLIAQDVEKSLSGKDFAGLCYDKEADKYMLRYDEFIAPIIKSIQELNNKIEELKNK